MFDLIIVGAGLAGSVLAREAANHQKRVLLIEKRNHIGGNAYDCYDENAILLHKYGPHIFHTQHQRVWNWMSEFTRWHLYEHKVLANIEGKHVPIPFNLNTLYQLFPLTLAQKLEITLLEQFTYGEKVPILRLMESGNELLRDLAAYIYKYVYYGYTTKQWGVSPEELDESVTSRVPVHISRDDRYFQDRYQGLPRQGYTKMFENILYHPKIHLVLQTDYKELLNIDHRLHKAILMGREFIGEIVFTGRIDEFFGYQYGELPYRSLRFEFESYHKSFYQEVSQVNYPNQYEFTRIAEYKHMNGPGELPFTTIAKEYPVEYDKDNIECNVPYYPIPQTQNHQLYQRYFQETDTYRNVHFIGRLAEYRYYNMDEIVLRALQLSDQLFRQGKRNI